MSIRWTLATQPSHPPIAPQSTEGITALTAAYAFLREIARRSPMPASDDAQEESADEPRPVTRTAEEIDA